MTPEELANKYLNKLSEKIDTNEKFELFRSGNPDFDKEVFLRVAKIKILDNIRKYNDVNLLSHQFLDILKNIKKSNIIIDLLETNNAYITHIKEDGSLQYVFTNYGYKKLKNFNLI